jgi:ABC-type transporter Mla subunit MlaD
MTDVRERVGAGGLRTRLIRQSKRSVRPALVLAVVFAFGALCAVYLLLHVDRTALVSSHRVSFQVADATAVQAGVDEVRFKGIPAGRIAKVAMVGTQPVVTVDIESRYGVIYRDARAILRPATPLQDMYLDVVDRGTPAAGRASTSNPVPPSRTDTSVHVGDVLDVFGADERVRLGQLLDGLGNGLSDRGAQLRTAFVDLVPFARVAGRITAQLDRQAPLTRRLVHNTSLLTTELGRRERQVRYLVDAGSATVSTLQAGAADLDATLRQLPPTMTSADDAFTAVRGVLANVDGAVSSLYPVADRLPQSLRDIRALTSRATPAVDALQRPVRALVPLARTLVPVSQNLSASVTRLLPQVPSLTKAVDDVGACLPDLDGFMKWDASMAKFGDALGAAPRGNAVIGAQSSGVLANPFEFAPQACVPGKAITGRVPRASDLH